MACCYHDFENRRVEVEANVSAVAPNGAVMPDSFCRPVILTVSGRVTGTNGQGASGVTVLYTVNGVANTVTTNGQGCYSFTAPRCACVTISISTGLGVIATPSQYVLWPLCENECGRNFTLRAVAEPVL